MKILGAVGATCTLALAYTLLAALFGRECHSGVLFRGDSAGDSHVAVALIGMGVFRFISISMTLLLYPKIVTNLLVEGTQWSIDCLCVRIIQLNSFRGLPALFRHLAVVPW